MKRLFAQNSTSIKPVSLIIYSSLSGCRWIRKVISNRDNKYVTGEIPTEECPPVLFM